MREKQHSSAKARRVLPCVRFCAENGENARTKQKAANLGECDRFVQMGNNQQKRTDFASILAEIINATKQPQLAVFRPVCDFVPRME